MQGRGAVRRGRRGGVGRMGPMGSACLKTSRAPSPTRPNIPERACQATAYAGHLAARRRAAAAWCVLVRLTLMSFAFARGCSSAVVPPPSRILLLPLLRVLLPPPCLVLPPLLPVALLLALSVRRSSCRSRVEGGSCLLLHGRVHSTALRVRERARGPGAAPPEAAGRRRRRRQGDTSSGRIVAVPAARPSARCAEAAWHGLHCLRSVAVRAVDREIWVGVALVCVRQLQWVRIHRNSCKRDEHKQRNAQVNMRINAPLPPVHTLSRGGHGCRPWPDPHDTTVQR